MPHKCREPRNLYPDPEGVPQFVQQPGSQNSEKSMVAKIPTLYAEASICPTKNGKSSSYFNFESFVIKTQHKVPKSPIFNLYFMKYFEILTFKPLKKTTSSKAHFKWLKNM